jgi:hypothetical protein
MLSKDLHLLTVYSPGGSLSQQWLLFWGDQSAFTSITSSSENNTAQEIVQTV